MKILMFAHQLEVGGTQVNAIELAAALRDFHDFEVVFFATPGPMVELVKEKGLTYVAAPEPGSHPSPARMGVLRDTVRSQRPGLIHAWDWWQCLDAYYGVYLPMRIPLVVTDMNMTLPRVLPKGLPTTFGTPELVDQARAEGRRPVELILPPVDVHLNSPGVVDGRAFREEHGIEKDDIVLVTASRLANWMKAESLARTIDAVRTLGRDLPLRFVVVGDGHERERLEGLSDKANAELGRRAVVLAGALLDPRPAYEAADIVVGMGGSALRGMAFGKAVVVVGVEGFSDVFSPETEDFFYYKGMYGWGDGNPDNSLLTDHIRGLASNPERIRALGTFSREFVVRHFSLEAVCERLIKFFHVAVAEMPRFHIAAFDGLRTAALCIRERRFLVEGHPLRRRIGLLTGRA